MKQFWRTVFVGIILLVLFNISCEKLDISTGIFRKPDYNFMAEDVGVKEAWIRLRYPATGIYKKIRLYRDTTMIFEGIPTIDTTLYDSLLTPHTRYLYYLMGKSEKSDFEKIKEISVTTLDTTSHNITWQVFEFYVTESGYIKDIAILNENDIWIVGHYNPTNHSGFVIGALHWTGKGWARVQVPFQWCPYNTLVYPSIYSVKFDNNGVPYFLWGMSLTHYVNKNFYFDCSLYNIFSYAATSMYIFSDNEIYIGGHYGEFAYFRNNSWTYYQVPVQTFCSDIWGIHESVTNEKIIMAVYYTPFQGDSAKIYKYKNNQLEVINQKGLPLSCGSIWSPNGKRWYVGSGGLYYSNNLKKGWKYMQGSNLVGFINKVRGNDLNDIFIVGNDGKIAHWNGSSWKTFFNINGSFLSLDVKNDIIVAGGNLQFGFVVGNPIVVIGRRN